MSTTPIFPGQLSDVETEAFSEAPTIVGPFEDNSQLSLSQLTRVIIPQDHEPIKTSGTQAPYTESYKITHEIGFGGYGAVWNGIQNNLNRRVALKTLKADVVAKPKIERLIWLFRQEAMTTAHLQHPNVVPVYDLTEDSNGLPVLAMKLVEGRQWNRVLSEDFTLITPLDFLERHLAVLISVAQAVAYAHSRGIIHRDLKPSQIMIGNYSEVLVMDWGLAMATRDSDGQVLCDPSIIIDSQSPLIKPMTPAGTPGYMAPEQKMKDATKLGPWTDVYLLGAILYELLTGLRPHESIKLGDPAGLQAQNDIVNPQLRTPHRDIPAQLSSLAMTAMATDPRDRVASVSAFADDLREYLTKAGNRGESMTLVTSVANSVLADELTYEHLQNCLEKLDRAQAQWPENQMASSLRHQILVTFARSALNNNDLMLARLQADRIMIESERLQILKEIDAADLDYKTRGQEMSKVRYQVTEERDRAEALVRFMLLDLHAELRTLGRVDLVHKVACEALNFFDSLHDDELNHENLLNRCTACVQIGDVLAELGRRDEAEGAYRRALASAEVLVSADPGNVKSRQLTAKCLGYLGRLYYVKGQLELAQQEYDKALQTQLDALELSVGNAELRRGIANTAHAMALILWRKQNYEAALHKLSESISYARAIHNAMPSSVDHQTDLAVYLASQSNIMRDLGDTDGALQAAQESLSMRIALSDQFPGDSRRKEEVYWVRANLCSVLLKRGEFERVLNNLKPDIAERRRMYEEDPLNILRTMGLTFHLSLLAEANFLLNKTDEAERLLAECLLHSRRLADQDDSNPGAMSRFAFHLVQMAELHAARGQWSEAERLATQSLQTARSSYWLSPDNNFVMRPLFQALAINARICMRHGKSVNASQLMLESRDVLSQTKGNRESAEYESLEARVEFASADPAALQALVKRLQNSRRMDPYLEAWAEEQLS